MKEKTTNLMAIVISFAAACFTFFMYLSKYLLKNKQISDQIEQLMMKLNIVEGRASFFLYILFFFCLIFFLILGFIIYKIIFKIAKVKINEIKLLLAVEMAYAVSFFIAYISIGYLPYILTVLLSNLVEMGVVVFMCIDEARPKLTKVILCRSILIVLSLLTGLLD